VTGVTERIRAIQARLGLEADGIVGPATLTAIERLLDRSLGPSEGPDLLTCSVPALRWIVRFEISTEAYYHRNLKHPYWPGGASGITVGIGYDLGYGSPAQIRRDWERELTDGDLALLCGAARLKARDAEVAVRDPDLRRVEVALSHAERVFYFASLPYHARKTRRAYPGCTELPADAQTALLSLVFNRGTRKSGSRRREMKAIEPLVLAGDLEGIARQIESMKRLWEGTGLDGLLERRDREADLVRHARRAYDTDELVNI
jgi:hypothetical protein